MVDVDPTTKDKAQNSIKLQESSSVMTSSSEKTHHTASSLQTVKRISKVVPVSNTSLNIAWLLELLAQLTYTLLGLGMFTYLIEAYVFYSTKNNWDTTTLRIFIILAIIPYILRYLVIFLVYRKQTFDYVHKIGVQSWINFIYEKIWPDDKGNIFDDDEHQSLTSDVKSKRSTKTKPKRKYYYRNWINQSKDTKLDGDKVPLFCLFVHNTEFNPFFGLFNYFLVFCHLIFYRYLFYIPNFSGRNNKDIIHMFVQFDWVAVFLGSGMLSFCSTFMYRAGLGRCGDLGFWVSGDLGI